MSASPAGASMLSIAPFKISKGLKRSCRRERVHNSSWSYLSSSSPWVRANPSSSQHSSANLLNRNIRSYETSQAGDGGSNQHRGCSEANEASKRKEPEDSFSETRSLQLDKWLRHIITMRKKKMSMREKSGANVNEPSMSLDEKLLNISMNKHSEDEMRSKKEEIERSIVDHYNGRSPFSNHLTSYDTETLHAIDEVNGHVSFVLNLYPGGFSLHSPTDNEMLAAPRAYDPSSKKFLQSLDRGMLPLDLLKDLQGNVDFKYEQGCIVVEVRDYRQPRQYDLRPSTHRMILRPDASSLQQDLNQIWQIHANLSMEDILILEKLLLVTTKPTLCLDPSPSVQVVANYMNRKSSRLQVWHQRPPRPVRSEFRQEFDAAVLKRAHASAHLFNRDTQSMERLEKYAHRRIVRDREKFLLAPASRDSLFASQAMKEPLDEPDDKIVGGVVQETLHGMAKILRHLKPRAAQEDNEAHREKAILSRIKASLASSSNEVDSNGDDSSADNSQDSAAANRLIIPSQPRGGLPPERQMRFKKNRQLATIWIQLRAASSYHVMMRIDDIGPDGKAVEGSQAVVHPLIIGNGRLAQLYGSQQVMIMQREGWTCTFDSHQILAKRGAAQANGTGNSASSSSHKDGDVKVDPSSLVRQSLSQPASSQQPSTVKTVQPTSSSAPPPGGSAGAQHRPTVPAQSPAPAQSAPMQAMRKTGGPTSYSVGRGHMMGMGNVQAGQGGMLHQHPQPVPSSQAVAHRGYGVPQHSMHPHPHSHQPPQGMPAGHPQPARSYGQAGQLGRGNVPVPGRQTGPHGVPGATMVAVSGGCLPHQIYQQQHMMARPPPQQMGGMGSYAGMACAPPQNKVVPSKSAPPQLPHHMPNNQQNPNG
mmetsp:Transcript_14487/g.49474  ORF Transcript_14487/g.49474 Transcript_14487/m.49474 type:complete len:873 (-) Transcript_14487:601-3219(-)